MTSWFHDQKDLPTFQHWQLLNVEVMYQDQRLEQILTIVDALADKVSDTGASVQALRGPHTSEKMQYEKRLWLEDSAVQVS